MSLEGSSQNRIENKNILSLDLEVIFGYKFLEFDLKNNVYSFYSHVSEVILRFSLVLYYLVFTIIFVVISSFDQDIVTVTRFTFISKKQNQTKTTKIWIKYMEQQSLRH